MIHGPGHVPRRCSERLVFALMINNPPRDLDDGVREEIDRIMQLWAQARARFGGTGEFLFGDGLRIPGLRSPAGVIVVLTSVLYPYVYVLGRSAFLRTAICPA